jgi:hypothetical protein
MPILKQQAAYDRFARALDGVSWDWLDVNHPELAGAAARWLSEDGE